MTVSNFNAEDFSAVQRMEEFLSKSFLQPL